MYNSIKSWMKIPISIKPYLSRTGTGDKVYGDTIEELGYVASEVKAITSREGVELVSSTQLYLDGSVQVKDLDSIILDNYEREIKAINKFYRGAAVDIIVVYL